MPLIVGKASFGTIPAGGSHTHYVSDDFVGSVETSDGAPGGTSGAGKLEAGFVMQYDDYCKTATCNTQTCTNTYGTFPMKVPPIVPPNPQPPFYACPGNQVAYTVEFCPGGNLLNPNTGITIHPNGNKSKCLDVRGAVFKNGTPVQIYDCNGTSAQKWVIRRGTTAIQVAGRNYCLDSSTTAKSGTKMKIWQCYPGIPAQTWSYSSLNNYISRLGADQCLDLTNGGLWNSNPVQTWRCSIDNKNQVWTV
ncbi:hypothetical protein CVT24_013206 [Panaeolus cyanescens]|uniref:Ricin B lectin domain-containing protein n=1 Tax=Panaeolus cyanescens TaxID=181874 RepID=A0A409YP16_9AGAR|nr:hypothetical protein CVT24_013206 [Panaeolus cyanescens]